MIRAKTATTDDGEDILDDISDGFGVLKAVPVHFFLPGTQPMANLLVVLCVHLF